jgi:hypothetical protein
MAAARPAGAPAGAAGLREVCYRAKAAVFPSQMIAGLHTPPFVSCPHETTCTVLLLWELTGAIRLNACGHTLAKAASGS